MENLFTRLYEVESTASSILDQANTKKKQLTNEQEERIRSFHEELHRETEEKINCQKEKLYSQIRTELEQERTQIEKQLLFLDQEYASNHSILAKQLLDKLIKE